MPAQDTTKIKDAIIEFLNSNGPSLPVQISRHIKIDTLFTSAFLSELLNQQKIFITNMKVGSSPIYYVKGTEEGFEKYSEYLKSKEKEAYLKLKEEKFLEDEKLEPAIRIAIRSIKDFAKPFQLENRIIWRYYLVADTEYKKEEKLIPKKEPEKEIEKEEIKEEVIEKPKEEATEKEKEIKEEKKEKKPKKKTPPKKKTSATKDDKFFNKVKEFLTQKQIEITGIEGVSKEDLTLKINQNGEEKLLIAYNKKRVSEDEIIKAYKKAKDTNLKYTIMSLGEPLKKISNFLDAIKDLEGIEKIE